MICGNQRRIVNNCRRLSRGTNRGRDEHIYRDFRELCFRSTDDAGIKKRDEFFKPRPRPHRAEPLSGFTAARSVISKSGDPFPRFRIRFLYMDRHHEQVRSFAIPANQTPTWAKASALAEEWELNRLAELSDALVPPVLHAESTLHRRVRFFRSWPALDETLLFDETYASVVMAINTRK